MPSRYLASAGTTVELLTYCYPRVPSCALLQSFDLQRVLEGEKALRSEATRQLKEVEKKLVSLRSPAVSLSSPMPAPPGSEQSLEADKALLQDQIKAHSAQVASSSQHQIRVSHCNGTGCRERVCASPASFQHKVCVPLLWHRMP